MEQQTTHGEIKNNISTHESKIEFKKKFQEEEKKRKILLTKREKIALTIVISIHCATIFILSLTKHWNHLTSLNDLGVFDQVLWEISRGDGFHNTINPFNRPINWLGFHFNPILMALVPFYAIHPSPIWLLAAQSFALSITAWPIYHLSLYISRSHKEGIAWSIFYLINPFLVSAALWDFHPVTLATPFFALAFLGVEKKSFTLLTASAIVMGITAEHFGMSVIGFGLLWLLKNKTWKPAAFLATLGLAQLVIVLQIIMPALSPTGSAIMLSKDMGQLSRYSWLGGSIVDVVRNILRNPAGTLQTVMHEMGGANYLYSLFSNFILLPLIAPAYLLPGLGDFLTNLLSANPMPRSIFSYHTVTLTPVLTCSSIYGAKNLSSKLKRYSTLNLAGFCIISSTALAILFYGPFANSRIKSPWIPMAKVSAPISSTEVSKALIDVEESVSAQANIGAYFSERHEIYTYPGNIGSVTTIILHLESPTKSIWPNDPTSVGTLSHHLQMNLSDYLFSIECLLSKDEYQPAYWKNNLLILSKKIKTNIDRDEITRRISTLREEWGLPPKRNSSPDKFCPTYFSPQN